MPPKKRTAQQHTNSLDVSRRSTRSATPVHKDADKPGAATCDEIKFLVNRLSRVAMEEIVLDALMDQNLTRAKLQKMIVDGLPRSLRNMKKKKTDAITWRGVNRAGMGMMGMVPGELIVQILNYLPFRHRLKMVIFVAKGFLGLMHEKSLWRDVENSPQVDGGILAVMICPTLLGQPLLPAGCIRTLGIDLDYCSSEWIIQILRRLHSKNHPLTSLCIDGTRKKMAHVLAALLKQAQGPRTSTLMNLSRINKLTIITDYNHRPALEVLRKLFEFLPKLAHLDISHDGVSSRFTYIEYQHPTFVTISILLDLSRSGELLRAGASHVSHNYLTTLYLSSWSASLSALEQLGSYFPELERLKIGMIGPREDDDLPMSLMPRLRSFEVFGYSPLVTEDDLSWYFVNVLAHAPLIEKLFFLNVHLPLRKYELFKAAKYLQGRQPAVALNSPELKWVELMGWCIDFTCVFGERKVWWCPKLVTGYLRACAWEKDVADLGQLGVWEYLPAD